MQVGMMVRRDVASCKDESILARERTLHIERLQVEAEGFLAGLDVEFSSGLNVIIGARGTGKTSLIELIRFCVDAGAFTEDAAAKGRQQAIATLEGGAVTLTVRDGRDRFQITRSASGHQTTTATRTFRCTVLAQNEIETVGAQAAGRLHLIDRFRGDREATERSTAAARAQLRSLTEELGALLQDVRAINDNVEAFTSIPGELDEARNFQEQLLQNSFATEKQREDLSKLQRASQMVSTRGSVIESDARSLSSFTAQIDHLRAQAAHVLQPWPIEAGDDPYGDARSAIGALGELLNQTVEYLKTLETAVIEASLATTELRNRIDERSRDVRQTLDAAQAGVGSAARRVAELEERIGRLEALRASVAEKQARIEEATVKRDAAYRQLEDIRNSIFVERSGIAAALNAELAPTVRARIVQSLSIEKYQAAIVASLRGSGVHYNNLAPVLAREVSPFELSSWVEQGDTSSLATAAGISIDRAHSVIAAIRARGVSELISAEIEDGVSLELLDGLDYKSTEKLSIGQRCTAVLPVLLGQHGDPLILDQPEDHLDNAFITSTLVPSLRRRHPSDQFIFSSHNANIPVLGGADRVIVMKSDGEHGRVVHQGNLDHPDTIDAVSQLMEGGREAFATRSDFYSGSAA